MEFKLIRKPKDISEQFLLGKIIKLPDNHRLYEDLSLICNQGYHRRKERKLLLIFYLSEFQLFGFLKNYGEGPFANKLGQLWIGNSLILILKKAVS